MKNLFLLGLLATILFSCNNEEVVTAPAVVADTLSVDSMLVEQPLDSLADSIVKDTVKIAK
jgi:hypothetical protein